jgi:hypothetical protein
VDHPTQSCLGQIFLSHVSTSDVATSLSIYKKLSHLCVYIATLQDLYVYVQCCNI